MKNNYEKIKDALACPDIELRHKLIDIRTQFKKELAEDKYCIVRRSK